MIAVNVRNLASIRRHTTRAAILLLTLASLGSVAAAAQQRQLAKADIPFDFSAGSQILPAGEYNLSQISSGIYRLQSKDTRYTQFLTGTGLDKPKNPDKGRLTFHRYGNRYFFQSAWFGTENHGVKMPTQKSEKTYAAQMIAAQTTAADTVVAMQAPNARP